MAPPETTTDAAPALQAARLHPWRKPSESRLAKKCRRGAGVLGMPREQRRGAGRRGLLLAFATGSKGGGAVPARNVTITAFQHAQTA
jgi:hypothetical protein